MYQVGMTGGTFPQEKLNVLRLVLRAVGPQYITVIFPSVVCNKQDSDHLMFRASYTIQLPLTCVDN